MTTGVGIAVTGTILAALVVGDLAGPAWTATQSAQFERAGTTAGLALTVLAGALVGWAVLRTRRAAGAQVQRDVAAVAPDSLPASTP